VSCVAQDTDSLLQDCGVCGSEERVVPHCHFSHLCLAHGVHRGEKLYVTKDKRRSQSWRRCICWGIGFVLLSVAILIAVLAGSKYACPYRIINGSEFMETASVVPGYRSRGLGSIPGATRLSETQWVWNVVHSAS
jgi:hypothetical protein